MVTSSDESKAGKTGAAEKKVSVKLSSGRKVSAPQSLSVLQIRKESRKDSVLKAGPGGPGGMVGKGFSVGAPASTATRLSHEALAQIAAAFRPA
jgi:hypothetical protein